MKLIDYYLDRVTMYRLLVYYLVVLLGAAMLLGAFGYLSYNPLAIAISAGYLLAVCVIANRVFSQVFEAAANPESSQITALILALIITPPHGLRDFLFLTAAGGLAIASKYILAINKKHIFNPAAVAVALTAIGAQQSASWWVGTSTMVPFVLVGGVLLVRKIRRGQMVMVFFATALMATTVFTILNGGNVVTTLKGTILHSSLLFLAFVMLTEPLTSPTMLKQQRWYGVLAGVLIPPQVHLGSLYTTPELALVVSNAFSYVISPRAKRVLKLEKTLSWGPSIKDFIFDAKKLDYKPGQYMEFTLPHAKPDNRGSRRYLTLASSPTEDNLRVGVKFYPKGSSFKRALWSMNQSTIMAADGLGGDFILPDDPTRKLAFIAGGIGVTPFRSMTKYLLDTGDKRSVTLLYSERTAADLAYSDVFNAARRQPSMKVVYALSDVNAIGPDWMKKGFITADMIKQEVPDYAERLFYISGPHSMVSAMQEMLRGLGVDDHNIKIDFFPGYA